MTNRFNPPAPPRTRTVCLAAWAVALLACPIVVSSSSANDGRSVRFNRDIRPILSETCFHCHGPDEHGRQADLRLDTAEGAGADLGGYRPITPGDLDSSEAWTRIISDDPDLQMPPPQSHLTLTEKQKLLMRRWIEQGANYEGHWAFVAPQSPEVPEVDRSQFNAGENWGEREIDAFIAAGLVEQSMTPSPGADPRTLIRRLTLDLTGLPPSVAEVRDFVDDYSDRGEAAYQDAITRLLGSRHFGERMAVPWMDQARYADTNGYSIDGGRDMWLWRDWVIEAYNDNLPFDQFVRDQIAGDLIPGATEDQIVASGFNRNHMITHEGGTIPEENLTNYAADRVKTTSEVFMGLTMGCAQCHDHKYDPISQKEYYQFFAFFNELDDRGLDGNAGQNAMPKIMATTSLDKAEVDSLRQELAQLESQWSRDEVGFESWVAQTRELERLRGRGFELLPVEIIDASSPNRPGEYEILRDGSVQIANPSKGLNGFSHSLRLPEKNTAPIRGLRIGFLPFAKDSDTKPVLTPFADAVPKVTTVLVSAGDQPTKQVDIHQQVTFAGATASSSAEDHDACSVLDERNSRWWQPADGKHEQHLTLTFDQPIDPARQPFLSVLVFFGVNQSLPHHWRIEAFTGDRPRQQPTPGDRHHSRHTDAVVDG